MRTHLLAASALAAALAMSGSAFAQTNSTTSGQTQAGQVQSAPEAGMTGSTKTGTQSYDRNGNYSEPGSPQAGAQGYHNTSDQSTAGQQGAMGQAGASGQEQGTSLSGLQNAKMTLSSAKVQDKAGRTIGRVRDVKTAQNGTPKAIEITLTSNSKTLNVPAQDMSYMKQSNTLRLKKSTTQLEHNNAASGT